MVRQLTYNLLKSDTDAVILDLVMMQQVHEFLTREDAQDLIEYTLLLAFIVFTCIGLAAGFSSSIVGIVGVSNSQIGAANTMVS